MRLLLLVVLCLIAPTAMAAGNIFDVNPTDQSLTMLGHIFGVVGELQLGLGQGGGLLGSMFKTFNTIVLTLGGSILLYTLIISTINTAQEGEMMGKKWSSVWVPIRAVLGVALLIPTASGYSLIQVIVMWVVVQGVGAANSVWGDTLDYYKEHGGTSDLLSAEDFAATALEIRMGEIFQAYVCMATINQLQDNFVVNPYIVDDQSGNETKYLKFGDEGDINLESICGSMQFDKTPDDESGIALRDAKITAVAAMGNWFLDASEELASHTSGSLPGAPNQFKKGAKQAYVGRLADFNQTFVGACEAGHECSNAESVMLDKAKDFGWALAGSYYFMIAKAASTTWKEEALTIPSFITLPTIASNDLGPPASYGGVDLKTEVLKRILGDNSLMKQYLAADKDVDIYGIGLGLRPLPTGPGGAVGEIMAVLGKVGGFFVNTIIGMMGGSGSDAVEILNSNPLEQIRMVASITLAAIELVWISAAIITFFVMMAAATMSCANPTGFAVQGFLNFTLPVIIGLVGLLWATCAILAYYIPMIPFIVFIVGVIGWMILVIEAIVAAPIVAIGFTAPSGDELGRVAPALMLILGIFLRPTLMIFGFVLSIFLLKIAIFLLNFGFMQTFEATGSYISLFGAAAVLSIYTGLLLLFVNKAFSLIHILPDRVLRWIGGQAEASGSEQALSEVGGKAKAGAKAGASMTAGALKSGGKSADKKLEKQADSGGGGSATQG